MNRTAELFLQWAEKMHGTLVRGQQVEMCELTLDTNGDKVPRVFLRVIFRENPVSNESPEMNVLQQAFSEIPDHAYSPPMTMDEALRIFEGEADVDLWCLSDELPPQPQPVD